MTDKIPPLWMDKATLGYNICASDATVDNWVAQGILPPPRKRGGKLMWETAEVNERLRLGDAAKPGGDTAERIRDATRRAASEIRPR